VFVCLSYVCGWQNFAAWSNLATAYIKAGNKYANSICLAVVFICHFCTCILIIITVEVLCGFVSKFDFDVSALFTYIVHQLSLFL